MNILLIGGTSSLINHLILKLRKEGHRVFLLTGSKYKKINTKKYSKDMISLMKEIIFGRYLTVSARISPFLWEPLTATIGGRRKAEKQFDLLPT